MSETINVPRGLVCQVIKRLSTFHQGDLSSELTALISAAPKPAQDDAEDAARYRWLRENLKYGLYGSQLDDVFTDSGDKLDRIVDAAMGSKGDE